MTRWKESRRREQQDRHGLSVLYNLLHLSRRLAETGDGLRSSLLASFAGGAVRLRIPE